MSEPAHCGLSQPKKPMTMKPMHDVMLMIIMNLSAPVTESLILDTTLPLMIGPKHSDNPPTTAETEMTSRCFVELMPSSY